MARTVADAAVVLSVLAAADAADAITKNLVTIGLLDHTRFLIPSGLQGARIGVVRQKLKRAQWAAAVFDLAIANLRRLGAEIADPVEIPHLDEHREIEDEFLRVEFKADLNAYLGWLGPKARVHSLEDVIAFNERERARSMPFFGQEIFEQARTKGSLTEAKYLAALERIRRLAGPDGIDAALKRQQLDALVSPTEKPAWLTDLVHGDPPTPGISSVAAVAGYPHVTVPAGFVFGLPVGLSFIGPAWSEPAFVRMAYAYEQGTKRRRAPAYSPTAPLTK